MRSERASVDKCGIRNSFESGALSVLVGAKGVSANEMAVGRKKVLSTAETDFVR
jgi:hypothetical protein